MASSDLIDGSLVAKGVTWDSFGLDPRLTRAVNKLGWSNPTLVQGAAIPRVLQGKDVLAKAKTGSGKTAAYAVPMVQKILTEKEGITVTSGIRGLILVPTRELCEQASEVLGMLTAYCNHLVRHVFIANDSPIDTQAHRLAELPDIVISTPGRLVQHLERGSLKLVKSLKMIVVDEADLVFSYGYEQDMEKISKFMPKICQGFLASATLGSTVESLKKLILHTPVVLKLEEEKDKSLLLRQYFVKNQGWDEKFLQLYVLFKMKVISGKTIVFVNSIEGCYRLKLFLERLSVKSAVLNSELPQNSRYHIVQEFNKGLFHVLIATDEANKGEADDSDDEVDENEPSSDDSDSEKSASESSDSESDEPIKSKKAKKTDTKAKSKAESKVDEKESKKSKADKKKVSIVDSDDSDGSVSDMDGEPFSSDAMDVDGELEDDDVENFGSSSDDDEGSLQGDEEDSDEGQTVEEARQEAEEAIKEIDGHRNVSKNALKVMQERLAELKKAQIREDAANDDSGSEEEDGADKKTDAKKTALKNGASATTKASIARTRAPQRGGSRKDAEYGVSRGVDFRGIKTVVNFDFPRSSRAYTHRVGRTARAGQAGTALSFVTSRDAELLATVTAVQKTEGLEIKPYEFSSAALDSFRYRVEGVLRTVTDLSIREARYEEIRREILGTQKLETFLLENPREMELLKHDKSLLESKINPRLKTVPDYILTQPELAGSQQLADKDHEEHYLEHFGARKRFGKRRLTTDPLKTFAHPAKKQKGKDDATPTRGGRGGRGGRGRGGGRGGGRRHTGVGSGFGPGS